MDAHEYDAYLKASFLAMCAEDYWRAWGLSPGAREVHDRVRRQGGLKLFEEVQRLIAAGSSGGRELVE